MFQRVIGRVERIGGFSGRKESGVAGEEMLESQIGDEVAVAGGDAAS